jgi:hypothetical protein
MIVFDAILMMLAVAVLLLAFAHTFKLPYPVLLSLAGAAVAVAQVDVGLHLNPELALALFIAPVLLDATYDTSLRDLTRHWGPVAMAPDRGRDRLTIRELQRRAAKLVVLAFFRRPAFSQRPKPPRATRMPRRRA